MKVSELINKLRIFPDNLEVRIMNVAIEDDESCPTFEIKGIEAASADEYFNPKKDVDFVFIQHLDNEYIQEEYNVAK